MTAPGRFLRFSLAPAGADDHPHYLRLGYRPKGSAEPDAVRPTICDVAAEEPGIVLRTTGNYYKRVGEVTAMTFGRKLTESVAGDDSETVTSGDWSLDARAGKIDVTAGDTITVSADDDLTIRAALGYYVRSNQAFDHAVSTGNYFSLIFGWDFSIVLGLKLKTFVGGGAGINLAGDLILAPAMVSAVGGKVGLYGRSTTFCKQGFSLGLGAKKYTPIDGKRVVYYKKITKFQFYTELSDCGLKSLVNESATYTGETQAAKVRAAAVKAAFTKLVRSKA